jgi:hypothetical protein
MTSLSPPRWDPAATQQHPAHAASRRIAAQALRSASSSLARLAWRLATPAALPPAHRPRLEFYAEAGAPEGARYLDGRLVGWIEGVRRL